MITQERTDQIGQPEAVPQFNPADYDRLQDEMSDILSGRIPSPESIDKAADLMWQHQDMLVASLAHDEYIKPTLALYKSMMLDVPYHPSAASDRAIGDARDTARIIFYHSLPAIQTALDERPDDAEIYKDSLELAAGDKTLADQRTLVDFMLHNLRAAMNSSGFTYAKEQAGVGLDTESSIDLMAESIGDYEYVFKAILDRGDEDRRERAAKLSKDIESDVAELGEYFLSGLGLDYDSFRASWRRAFPKDRYFIYEKENLKKMRGLEAQHPGICKELHERFSIKNFARYPNSLLTAQYEQRDDADIPYGIMLTANDDYNDAFYNEANLVGDLYTKLAELGRALRVYEAELPLSVPRRIIESAARYGKPEFGILNAHGDPAGLLIGGEEGRHSKERSILSSDILRLPTEKMAKYMAEDMEWVLLSCSAGRSIRRRFFRRPVPSIAQTLSGKLPDQQFIAPARNIIVEGLDPIVGRDGQIRIEPVLQEVDERLHDPKTFRAGALATKLGSIELKSLMAIWHVAPYYPDGEV